MLQNSTIQGRQSMSFSLKPVEHRIQYFDLRLDLTRFQQHHPAVGSLQAILIKAPE